MTSLVFIYFGNFVFILLVGRNKNIANPFENFISFFFFSSFLRRKKCTLASHPLTKMNGFLFFLCALASAEKSRKVRDFTSGDKNEKKEE